MHSNMMDRAWQTLRQHWSTILSKKVKEDNRKKINGGRRSDEYHSGINGSQAQSEGAHTSEPHINGAV